MKLLVLTSEPITSEQLGCALPPDAEPERSEVRVVAPALQLSGFRFWLSDADEAIARARRVRSQTVDQLGAEGVPASGDTGESDPVQAIEDALQTSPADRIVIFTHRGSDRRYREDVDVAEVEERFGIPVDHAGLSA
jgi:hypothetical protein